MDSGYDELLRAYANPGFDIGSLPGIIKYMVLVDMSLERLNQREDGSKIIPFCSEGLNQDHSKRYS